MCDECIDLCPHTPGGDPIEPADSPEAQSQSDALAKRILNGLGFCGHYMHFHGGGVSGIFRLFNFGGERGSCGSRPLAFRDLERLVAGSEDGEIWLI